MQSNDVYEHITLDHLLLRSEKVCAKVLTQNYHFQCTRLLQFILLQHRLQKKRSFYVLSTENFILYNVLYIIYSKMAIYMSIEMIFLRSEAKYHGGIF